MMNLPTALNRPGLGIRPLAPKGMHRPSSPPRTVSTRIAVPSADVDVAALSAPPSHPTPASTPAATSTVVRIDNEWYDLTQWRQAHPAGPHWIDVFNGRDATEVFYAFHSDYAQKILPRLPKAQNPPAADALPPLTPLTLEFRQLRQRLIQEGWFQRDWAHEFAHFAAWAGLVASGVACAWSPDPLLQSLAFLPIGLSFTTAGWLAHDMIHGRGKWCDLMRHFGGWAAGFSATMWSNKHNMHHAVTNVMGMDEDLSGGPLLWLWAPDPSRDKPWRPFQGIYALFLFSFLHVIWRIDSVRTVLDDKRIWKTEGIPLLAHYLAYSLLVGPGTLFMGVLFGGWVMANITSTTHQSEDLKLEPDHDWVKLQFETSRDAKCRNAFTEWLWGGMQYQTTHHLFPTLPRYKYPRVVPLVKELAARHGVEYRESDEWEMVFRNYANYRRVGALEAQPGAPMPRKGKSI